MTLPVVLIPGLNCSARLWAPQIPALWSVAAGVFVADHRRGETVGEIAAAILADAPGRFALVGLSMGGHLAFEILRREPQRVARLVLFDTHARADPADKRHVRLDWIARTQAGRFDEIPALQWPLLVARRHHADTALRAEVDAMARETGAAGFVRQVKAILDRPDSRPMLRDITCPTTIICGAEDELTPPALSQEMADAIPGAKLVLIPQAGHLPTLEKPEVATAALLTALG